MASEALSMYISLYQSRDGDANSIHYSNSSSKRRKLDHLESKPQIKANPSSASSSSDEDPSSPPTKQSSKSKHISGRKYRKPKVYICQYCNVPKKGHTCPFKNTNNQQRSAPKEKRGSYKCRRCGDTLKGHICTLIDQDIDAQTSQSTHILAPAHLLIDIMHEYIQTNSIDEAKHKYLLQWASRVQDKLEHINQLAMQNIQHIAKAREVDKTLDQQRNENLALRTKIRNVDFQIQALERQIAKQKQLNRTSQHATQLLDTIDALRSNSTK